MDMKMLRLSSWITAVCVIVFIPKNNMLCTAAYKVLTVYHGNPSSAGPIIPYYMAVDVFNKRIFVTDHALPAIYVFTGFTDDGSLGKAELFAGNPEVPGWQDGPRLQPSTSASGPAAVLNGRLVPSSQTALFSRPEGICQDPSGNLFVLDHGDYTDPFNITHQYCLLRRIDAVTGLVTTVAGDRTSSRSKDGSGSNATFSTGTLDLKCDSSGTLWIADRSSGGAVRKVMCVGEDCGGTPPPSEPPSHNAAGLFSYALWAFAILGMATTILVGAQAADKASGQYMRYTISQLYSKWAGPGPQPHAFNITTIEVLESDGQSTILDPSAALLGDEVNGVVGLSWASATATSRRHDPSLLQYQPLRSSATSEADFDGQERQYGQTMACHEDRRVVDTTAAVEPSITMEVNSSLTSERCSDQGTDACADLLGLPGTKTHHQKTNDDTKPLIEL